MPTKPNAGPVSASTLGGNGGGRHWYDCARAVLEKDLRTEGRTRYAVGVTLLFAVCTVAGLSATLSASGVRADVKAALLWVTLLFAGLSGLARTFVREEEAGTASALRLYAPPTAVFVGKLAFNGVLMAATEAVTVPLFLAVLPPPHVNWALLFGVLILGGFGLASASTFAAALIAQAGGGRSALFFVVAFPVLLPLLLMASQATVGAFSDAPFFVSRAWNELALIGAYSVVVTTAALLLFGTIWRDE